MTNDLLSKKIEDNRVFNCKNLDNFIRSIYKVLPYKGISMSRFYVCQVGGIRFLTKMSFYRKSPMEIYGDKKYIADKNIIGGKEQVLTKSRLKPSKHKAHKTHNHQKKKKSSEPPLISPTKAIKIKDQQEVLTHQYIDAEIRILKLFKENIIYRNYTPCILELVHSCVCNSVDKLVPDDSICSRLMLDYRDTEPEDDVDQLLCKYNDLVKNGLAHNKCAFLVLEKCDITLDEYLRRGVDTPVTMAVFKSLLFLIIYTLYVIKKLYPKFVHYDLHTDNIMLKFDPNYKYKATNQRYIVVYIGKERYTVPYFGICPKIIDFGFSKIPEENIYSPATQDVQQMYYRSENDLLFLFHFIYDTVTKSGSDKYGRVDKLLSRLEPNRTYVHFYTEYIRKIEDKIPSYETMLKNYVFREYRKLNPSKHQIHNIYTSPCTKKHQSD